MTKENSINAASPKPVETEKPVKMEGEPEEKLDLNADNNSGESEECSEYEEVEEEVELEEEVEEEMEEDEEEGSEDTDEETRAANTDEDDIKKHKELLTLPPHGAEVYVGGIPHDASEEDLKSFCESVGEVTDVRMMKSKGSKENKGFAFVTFRTKELASKAIDDLNNTELKGKKIKCSKSQVKNRLFIGNIPKTWTRDDLLKVVEEVGPGIDSVDLVKDVKNSSCNRGFGFVEYYNHACAEYARQKMSKPKFKIGNIAPTVSWADSKNAESASNSEVKAVYVKNWPKDITQDKLKKLFKHHGEITKVVLPSAKSKDKNRIGFVHFAERSSAMKALKNTEKYEIDGQVLECSLAKPPSGRVSEAGSTLQKPPLGQSYPLHTGYGLVNGHGGTYGGLVAGYGATGFPQADVIGRLRLQYTKDLLKGGVRYKNKLILRLMEALVYPNPAAYRDKLIRFSTLNHRMYSELALKASRLLEQTKLSKLHSSIARSLSELEMFTEEGEQPYLVKGSVRMQWHRSGLIASWEFCEEHIEGRNRSEDQTIDYPMTEKCRERKWGAMVHH